MTTGWIFIVVGGFFSLKYVFEPTFRTIGVRFFGICPQGRLTV
jgi:hypothetical protein